MPGLSGLTERIEAATPATRDRTVDALRAIAISGVVPGHWLVTALVPGPGEIIVASPLKTMPWLAPISWVLQTLAVFFLVGGYVAAKGHKPGWARTRMARLLRPVPVLLIAWVPGSLLLLYAGYSGQAPRSALKLVVGPLWFLLVYAALTALTPLILTLWERLGWYAVGLTIGVVALADVTGLGRVNIMAAWLVPYLIGVAGARDGISPRTALAMLGAGALATTGLILYGGYPASMVGVPGAEASNLNPPTLAAVTFGIAQAGLALLLRDRLSAWMRRPSWWAAVALTNLSAMTVFLWHPDRHDRRHRRRRGPGRPARPAHPSRRPDLGAATAALAPGVRPGTGPRLGRRAPIRTPRTGTWRESHRGKVALLTT